MNTTTVAVAPRDGLVVAKSVGQYTVRTADGDVVCAISNRLRKELVYPIADPASLPRRVMSVRDIRTVDPVAVGDRVAFCDGQIQDVRPRRSRLSRRAPGSKPLEQVIVANVDQVMPVVALASPTPKWNVVDRYLVDCEAYELPPVLCLTKADLIGPEVPPEAEVFERVGYRVLRTSAQSGEGIEALRETLRGKLTALIGPSGVGKSSLLNALEPDLGIRVQAIGETTGKGKHTTTTVRMHELPCGGWLVDTPGMREFGLWQVPPDELPELFPEMRPLVGRCRFGRCTHLHEPGCAVREAVADGRVDGRRYRSYVALRGG